MAEFLQFLTGTFLFMAALPSFLRWYVRKYGVDVVVCMYIHRRDAEYLEYCAEWYDTLPCCLGQLFSTMPFKRATHSANFNCMAADFKAVLVRTNIREIGALDCYEGEKSLGITHVVLLEHLRKKDLEFIDEESSGKSSVSIVDVLRGLLIWYATLPLLLFSSPPMMGYKK